MEHSPSRVLVFDIGYSRHTVPPCEASLPQVVAYHGTAMRGSDGVSVSEALGLDAAERALRGELDPDRDLRAHLSLNATVVGRRLLFPYRFIIQGATIVDARTWAKRSPALPTPPTRPTVVRRVFSAALRPSDDSLSCELGRHFERLKSDRDDLSRVFPDSGRDSTRPIEYLELVFPWIPQVVAPGERSGLLDGPRDETWRLVAETDSYPLNPALGRLRMGRQLLNRFGGFHIPGATILDASLANWLLQDADLRYFPRYAWCTLVPESQPAPEL